VEGQVVALRYAQASEETRRQVDRLLEQDADDQAWAAQIGPVYRQADVAALLGKSKQAVSADPRLLKLELRSGEIGYPVMQFDGRRQLPGLGPVIRALDPVVASPWTSASWLTSPNSTLGGHTPIVALRGGRVDEVLRAARQYAAAAG
jgi:hypothetical protein